MCVSLSILYKPGTVMQHYKRSAPSTNACTLNHVRLWDRSRLRLAVDLVCFLICQQKDTRHGNTGRDNPFGDCISTLDFFEEKDTP